MYKLLKHILIFFSVVLIVAATGGIGLIQHYCSCEKETRSSLYSETFDCHMEDAAHCCQETQELPSESCCAQGPSEGSGNHPNGAEHNCCSTVYTYFKTDQVNLIKSIGTSLKFFAAYRVIFFIAETEYSAGRKLLSASNDKSPPPLYGIELLIQFHQLKSGPPVS